MTKKFFLIILLMVLSFMQVFGSNCNFDTYNSSCPRFSNSFNTFNLNFTNLNYGSFEARIYDKNNIANEFLIEIDTNLNTIKNINPFTQPGVYVVEVKTYTKANVSSISNFEYIYDNLEPLAPVVPLNLESSTDSITISGKTQESEGVLVIAKYNSNEVQVPVINGSFSLTLTGLNQGINYVKFHTKKEFSQRKSFEVERVVFFNSNNNIENNYYSKVSDITVNNNLESFNSRTIKVDNYYVTSKRNFYITGSAVGLSGSEIFVNGQRAIFDGTYFGAFVYLNQGENEIVVQSGMQREFLKVNYIDLNFKFLEVNSNEKIFSNDFVLNGNTSVNLPFDIYVNGEFLTTFDFSSYNQVLGVFTFTHTILESNFKPGKNYIYLQGFDNENLEFIVYKDNSLPEVEFISFGDINIDNKKLQFKMKDDISIDSSTVNLIIDTNLVPNNLMNITGNIYSFDISDFLEGQHSFNIDVKDKSGKSSELLEGSFNIISEPTLIDKFYSSNSDVYSEGKYLFLKSGNQELRIKPSKFIAFNKIYLDNIEQINYEILPDGTVILNADFNKAQGELKLNFINKDYESFTQNYIYYSDIEKPQVILDYIQKPYAAPGESIKITGKIIDSHFNWNTFKLNSNSDNLVRYGDYFEFNLIPTSNFENLQITAEDYSNNVYTKNYNAILRKDSTLTKIDSVIVEDSFSASLKDLNVLYPENSLIKNYIYSFNGFDIKKSYLKNQFELPLPQRNGLEYLNIKGFESSSNKFSSGIIEDIDSIKPLIYLYSNDMQNYKVIIDGTYSEVSFVNISSSGVALSFSDCLENVSVYSVCKKIDNLTEITSITVTAKDSAKNTVSKTFLLTDAITLLPVKGGNILDTFFSGVDIITQKSNIIIQGNYVSNSIATSSNITKDGVNIGVCILGENSFVCNVTLVEGLNNINVSFLTSEGIISKNTTIILDTKLPVITINQILAQRLFKVNDYTYYINSNNLTLDLSINKEGLIKVYIDGEVYSKGVKNGNFTVNVDLNNHINNLNSVNLSLSVSAEDEAENIGVSNVVTLIYNRFSSLFAIVSVN